MAPCLQVIQDQEKRQQQQHKIRRVRMESQERRKRHDQRELQAGSCLSRNPSNLVQRNSENADGGSHGCKVQCIR